MSKHIEGPLLDLLYIAAERDKLRKINADLLEALDLCLWMIESYEGRGDKTDSQIDRARAAIAKAREE